MRRLLHLDEVVTWVSTQQNNNRRVVLGRLLSTHFEDVAVHLSARFIGSFINILLMLLN